MKKMKKTKKKNNQMNKTTSLRSFESKITNRYFIVAGILILCMAMVIPAFAADDPLSIVNNMSDFIFSIIKALGMILLGFGIVQIGMSLKSHDASQRATGFMTFFGGLMIAFCKEILNLIMGG